MAETKKGVGQYLREAREMRGLALKEIAQETKINKNFLEALENEDWDSLPAEVYIRGYLRCYAEALGLDPKEVLLRYEALRGPKKHKGFEETVSFQHRSSSLYWVGLFLLVLLGLLAYLFLFSS